jgi:hypothetical protein
MSEPALVGYQYVTLRCVPRVERDEFVNVGVVLYSQSAEFLDAATLLDEAKVLALAAGTDLDAVRAALETIRSVCRGATVAGLPGEAGLGRRFGWLAATRSTVIQPGPIHGGLTADPSAELRRLLDCLVG